MDRGQEEFYYSTPYQLPEKSAIKCVSCEGRSTSRYLGENAIAVYRYGRQIGLLPVDRDRW